MVGSVFVCFVRVSFEVLREGCFEILLTAGDIKINAFICTVHDIISWVEMPKRLLNKSFTTLPQRTELSKPWVKNTSSKQMCYKIAGKTLKDDIKQYLVSGQITPKRLERY